MKKLRLFISASILSVIMSITALAGEWKQDSVGWWYQNDDGSYPTNSWITDNGKVYCVDQSGYMRTGWINTVDGKWYYANPSGELRTEDLLINDYTYRFDNSGACLNPGTESTDATNKNIQDINDRSTIEARKALLDESKQPDSTPGVNLWDENIVSVVEYSR